MNNVQPSQFPAPDRTARDASGRLVALTWNRAVPGRDAPTRRWLIALDGSQGALQAAAAAARLVAADGGGVDLVHVHHWLSHEAAEAELGLRGWQASAAARALLDEAGIHWRLHVRMGEAAEHIVALAQELDSLGIAIGSRGLSSAESLFLGSVAYKVVHLGKLPVLVVR